MGVPPPRGQCTQTAHSRLSTGRAAAPLNPEYEWWQCTRSLPPRAAAPLGRGKIPWNVAARQEDRCRDRTRAVVGLYFMPKASTMLLAKPLVVEASPFQAHMFRTTSAINMPVTDSSRTTNSRARMFQTV